MIIFEKIASFTSPIMSFMNLSLISIRVSLWPRLGLFYVFKAAFVLTEVTTFFTFSSNSKISVCIYTIPYWMASRKVIYLIVTYCVSVFVVHFSLFLCIKMWNIVFCFFFGGVYMCLILEGSLVYFCVYFKLIYFNSLLPSTLLISKK